MARGTYREGIVGGHMGRGGYRKRHMGREGIDAGHMGRGGYRRGTHGEGRV